MIEVGLFKNLIRASQTFSPLGLTGKAIRGESPIKPPSDAALKSGAQAGVVVGGALLGGEALSNNLKASDMSLTDRIQNVSTTGVKGLLGNVFGGASGNVSFGSRASSGFIPLLIGIAVAVAIIVGGGLFRVGKKRRR